MPTMKSRAKIAGALAILTIATACPLLADLDSCHDDLDRLHRTASDASDAAESAQSKLSDLDDCREQPEVHDLLGDHCRSLRSDYESAASDLESKMEELDTSLQTVQSSCGYQFSLNRMSPIDASKHHVDAAERRLCASYTRITALGVKGDSVLQMCKSGMSEEWCKTCLGLK